MIEERDARPPRGCLLLTLQKRVKCVNSSTVTCFPIETRSVSLGPRFILTGTKRTNSSSSPVYSYCNFVWGPDATWQTCSRNKQILKKIISPFQKKLRKNLISKFRLFITVEQIDTLGIFFTNFT
jgi:hypothetical protein